MNKDTRCYLLTKYITILQREVHNNPSQKTLEKLEEATQKLHDLLMDDSDDNAGESGISTVNPEVTYHVSAPSMPVKDIADEVMKKLTVAMDKSLDRKSRM